MYSRLAPCWTLLAVVVLAIIVVPATAQTSPTKLEVGKSIERTLGSGQSHAYTIVLGERQYLQFVVEQHGIDVVIQVVSPSGQTIARIDSPNGAQGPEHGSITSITGGTYTIIVAPLETTGPEGTTGSAGKYEIKTIELRDATEDELKIGMGEEYRKKKAIALLDEVIKSLPNVHQAQTRIRIKEQAAQLLWKIDEKQATKLLAECVRDAQEYASSFPLDAEDYYEAFSWSQQVRMEVVQLLANHDPEAAFDLLISTRKPIEIEAEQASTALEEKQFELSLAGQIAAKNPQRAYELAETSLKSGYSPTLIFTISQLRRSNADLATKLSKSLANKLLNETSFLESPQAVEFVMQLLRNSYGIPTAPSSPTAVADQAFSTEDRKALLQKALDEALHFKPKPTEPASPQYSYTQMILTTLRTSPNIKIDEILPGSSAAIDKKMTELGIGAGAHTYGDWVKYEQALNSESADEAMETIGQAPDYMREQLVRSLIQKTASSGNISQAKTIVNDNLKDPRERQRMLIDLERQAAQSDANSGDMESALKHVAKLPTLTARAEVIAEIASRIGQGQDKATALRLLETAKGLLGTSIRSERAEQMTALIRLAGAFAHYDSKRAIEIIEPLIEQFNELAEAARVLNGFGVEYFQNGELLLHDGNGLSSIAMPLANSLGELSIVDFDKAKQVSERISLPEVKLSLYLGMIQQVIAPGELSLQTTTYRDIIE